MAATTHKDDKENAGSLIVIGTGIKTVGQLTTEAIAWMREADTLLYVISEPVAEAVIKRLNPKGAVSLAVYYKEGEPRINAYNAMIEHILRCVRSGNKTVAAFYGHPGVFTYPSHAAVARAKEEGFSACMLPGVSAEDCLFADLGVDPAVSGCQSYEATDFLLNTRNTDPSTHLILWQIGVLGDWTYKRQIYDTRAMPLLVKKLMDTYPSDHEITLYQAAIFPGSQPVIDRIPLHALNDFPVRAAMTLYIPPAQARTPDPEIQSRLFEIAGHAFGEDPEEVR